MGWGGMLELTGCLQGVPVCAVTTEARAQMPSMEPAGGWRWGFGASSFPSIVARSPRNTHFYLQSEEPRYRYMTRRFCCVAPVIRSANDADSLV